MSRLIKILKKNKQRSSRYTFNEALGINSSWWGEVDTVTQPFPFYSVRMYNDWKSMNDFNMPSTNTYTNTDTFIAGCVTAGSGDIGLVMQGTLNTTSPTEKPLNTPASDDGEVPANYSNHAVFLQDVVDDIYTGGPLDGITWVQILNECDASYQSAGQMTGREIAAMMSAMYDGHKGTIPNAGSKFSNADVKVMLPALGRMEITTSTMEDFKNWCDVNRGVGDYPFDIFSFNHYPRTFDDVAQSPANYLTFVEYQSLVDYIKSTFGSDKEIWMTELGYNHEPTAPLYAAPQDRSNYHLQSYLISLASGVDRFMFYMLYNAGVTPGKHSNCGFMDNPNAPPNIASSVVTQTFNDLSAFITELSNYKFVRFNNYGNINEYVFTDGSDYCWVIYKDSGTVSVSVTDGNVIVPDNTTTGSTTNIIGTSSTNIGQIPTIIKASSISYTKPTAASTTTIQLNFGGGSSVEAGWNVVRGNVPNTWQSFADCAVNVNFANDITQETSGGKAEVKDVFPANVCVEAINFAYMEFETPSRIMIRDIENGTYTVKVLGTYEFDKVPIRISVNNSIFKDNSTANNNSTPLVFENVKVKNNQLLIKVYHLDGDWGSRIWVNAVHIEKTQ